MMLKQSTLLTSVSNRYCCVRWLRMVTTGILCFLFLLSDSATLWAQDGYPIAVSQVESGIEVQSFSGLKLSVKPGESPEKLRPDHVGLSGEFDQLYFRQPNENAVQWSEFSAQDAANAIRIRTWQPDKEVSDQEGDDKYSAVLMSVDGCTLLFADGNKLCSSTQLPEDLDLVCVFISKEQKAETLKTWATSDRVKRLLLVSAEEEAEGKVNELQQELSSDSLLTRKVGHNCFALSSTQADSDKLARQVITLSRSPWEMPEDMEVAFTAMESACSASQKVFAELSVEQMNFKPGNGTHTPRWNAEHMMGRQLLFFSQIYNRVDPTIPVLNLNPKQNPEDYVAAHADWTGAEEARQMQRVSEFTRKFAYLLDGVELDQRAPGSRWPTLNALLRQMDRHYSEHTANTEKKFELEDWPRE